MSTRLPLYNEKLEASINCLQNASVEVVTSVATLIKNAIQFLSYREDKNDIWLNLIESQRALLDLLDTKNIETEAGSKASSSCLENVELIFWRVVDHVSKSETKPSSKIILPTLDLVKRFTDSRAAIKINNFDTILQLFQGLAEHYNLSLKTPLEQDSSQKY